MGVTLQFRRLEPFGVEVLHDLSRSLGPSEAYHLGELFKHHGLILARGQTLSMARQREICGILGPILIRESEGEARDNAGGGPSAPELGWHADAAHTEAPFDAIALHALDVVDGASSTRFVSAESAWRDVPRDLAEALEGRDQHMISPHCTQLAGRTCDRDDPEAMKRALRPTVFTNPHNGRQCLWVSEMQTAALSGMEREDSRALLHAAFDELYAPERVFEHRWHKGDLVIWDNIALQHARGNVEGAGRRVLQRVIVGTEGVAPHVAG